MYQKISMKFRYLEVFFKDHEISLVFNIKFDIS